MSSTSDYLVGPIIGEGSFGHVVYALHKATDREVAIKVMDQVSMKKRPVLVRAVWMERKLLQQLQESPWVVNLWASFYDSNSVYLVMELASYGDLEGWMTSLRMSVDLCMNGKEDRTVNQDPLGPYAPGLASQIIEAVESLHTQYGILHCDLKPANILLKDDSQAPKIGCRIRILLADFACAVELNDDRGREDQMEEGQFPPRGTCDYASPEILRGSPPSQLTVASDYWSVGCILYAMLHRGHSPFHDQDRSQAQIIHSILTHGIQQSFQSGNLQVEAPSRDEDSEGPMRFQKSAISGVETLHADNESDSLKGTVQMPFPLKRTSEWVSAMSAGLIQAYTADRVAVWQMNLCHRYVKGSYADCGLKDMKEPPTPAWRDKVKNASLLDGALGWTAFEATA
jgi:serine/threonine protein kinase